MASFHDAISAFLRSSRTALLFALDTVCKLKTVPRRPVTVVLRLDAIGDFFIWMQSGAVDIALVARQGGRRSVLIANEAWADYARETGLWDDVLSVDPVRLMRRPFYRLQFLSRVRSLGATLLIQPRAAKVFLQEDAIARVSGAERRVGSAGSSINYSTWTRKWGNRFYEELLDVNEACHETIRNGDFVEALTGNRATRFEFPKLINIGSTRQISVAVGAGQAGRVWPVENLAKLVVYIKASRPGYRILLLGSSAELSRTSEIEKMTGGGLVNLVGKTSLSDLVETIAASDLVICNESSAYHIAMAVGTRVLCFLGGGHFGWYAPYPGSDSRQDTEKVLYFRMNCYRCNWKCIYPRDSGGAYKCVESISVEAAIEAVGELLPAACS